MMFKLKIGDSTALLSGDQLSALAKLLDEVTFWNERWRGSGKGFYGTDQEFELKFEPYRPSLHLRGVELFSDQEIDALSTLIVMRNQPKENENA